LSEERLINLENYPGSMGHTEEVKSVVVHCGLCEKGAGEFVIHADNSVEYRSVFSGIWRTMKSSDDVRSALAGRNWKELSSAVLKTVWFNCKSSAVPKVVEGLHLDAYCSECDLAYCREHWGGVLNVGGKGPYIVGTCPKGHTSTRFDWMKRMGNDPND